MWGVVARFICKDLLVPVIVAICIELILDHYRKEKARIHFRPDEKLSKKEEIKDVKVSKTPKKGKHPALKAVA